MRVLGIVGKVLAWLLLVVYFIYLRFPYDQVRPRLEDQLAKVGAVEISFGHVGPDGIGGLRLTDVTLSPRSRSRPVSPDSRLSYHIDRLDARPRILSLVRGRAGVHLDARGYGGRVSGTVVQASDTEFEIDLEIDDLALDEIPMPKEGKIEGVLNAEIDDLLVVPGQSVQGLNGRIEFDGSEGAVLPFRTRTTRIPPQPVRFTRFAAAVSFEAGQARVESLELTGPDLSARGEAEITLNRNLSRSAVTGELKVKFEESFAVYEDVVQGLTRARKDSEGFLVLPLNGTLARPM